ncbi:ATP-dependent nuclease [Blastococcus capsensis]|uniref:ATP-dependent nuclease n=1 Tax=Blastococcus capsensis TaxID=1564163 RepID=UPI00254154CC|nr:ATP-binding protein [Blastococcus capsensis]MDK3258174.1 ATP-binding protein [Blastococcus capsensis]
MRVRRLAVQNFRGIKRCDWNVEPRLVALVGAGDATKTTLLDALGLVLSPSYSPQFTDADFYRCNTSEPIVIEAAVTELPDHLIQESQFGKDRSGIRADGTFEHDPIDDTEECLIIRLTVNDELEPTWEVVRPGDEEGRPISASQRARLGFFRVGERVDLHLRWARTSALTGLTENRSGAASIILAAQRGAREAVFDAAPEQLMEAATLAQTSARRLGSAPFGRLRPGLEPTGASSAHSLILHDEDIPLTGFGLGTRRLTSLSIQDQAVEGGSIVVVDEIEHGLEPHRLAHVLHYLSQRTSSGELQVLLTTHSPIAVESMQASDLNVVRSEAGETVVQRVSAELDDVQGMLRAAPSALLGRRILIGEGATEVGLIRGLLRRADNRRRADQLPISATLGVAIVDGRGGNQAVRRGALFGELGYPVTVLIDNDDASIDTEVAAAEAKGVRVIRWTQGRALEDELIRCLDEAGLHSLVQLAAEIKGEESVRASVEARLDGASLAGLDPSAWALGATRTPEAVRDAIAGSAVGRKVAGGGKEEKKGWFKSEDAGEQLAALVATNWSHLSKTEMGSVVTSLLAFAYEPVATEESQPSGGSDAA